MRVRRLSIVLMVIAGLLGCRWFIGGGNSVRSDREQTISEKYGVPEEKQLIVYTSHKEEVYLPIIREFESQTGIWVEIHAGGTTEILSQVREAAAKGECDIMFGGGIENYAANQDLFIPYVTSEESALNDAFCSDGNYWTPFTELPIVFVYNNKLVSQKDAPTGWNDLFRERWKGRIAFADPENSGSSYTMLSTLRQITGEEPEDILPRFYQQLEGKTVANSGEVLPGVSDGTYLIGITLEETALKYISRTKDISICYPQDGTSAVPDGCAMVYGTLHSYNAGRFIDFVVGMDAQRYAIEQFRRRTVRTDIDIEKLYEDINADIQNKIVLIDYNTELASREEREILALWGKLSESDGDGE